MIIEDKLPNLDINTKSKKRIKKYFKPLQIH